MLDLDLIGKAIAQAIWQSRKWQAKEQGESLDFVINNSARDDLKENCFRVNNSSAIRQELEKSELIDKKAHEDSALCRHVRKHVDELMLAAEAKAKATPKAP